MNTREIMRTLLHVTSAYQQYHDHQRFDPAHRRYFMRLPDGTQVPIDEYEEARRRYNERQARKESASDMADRRGR